MRLMSLVVALVVVGCVEPSIVSSDTSTSATSSPSSTGRSTTGATVSSTTTTFSGPDDEFPVIELTDPDPTVHGLDVPVFDVDTFLHLRPPVFDLSSIARVHSYRLESVIDLGEEVSFRTSSETAGLTTRVRIDIAPFDDQNPTEWIITPAGVWALIADEWVFYDPNEGESAFIVALAPKREPFRLKGHRRIGRGKPRWSRRQSRVELRL